MFKESLVSSGIHMLYSCRVWQSFFDFFIVQWVVDCSCTNQKCGNRVIKRTVTFISVGQLGGKYFYPKFVKLHLTNRLFYHKARVA